MLRVILTATAVMAAGSAMASSIEVISGTRTGNNSVLAVSCTNCPALKPEVRKQIYDIPALDGSVQKVEIRENAAGQQIVRTENWSGGSPVVRISTASTWMPDTSGTMVAVRPVNGDDGIDTATTTAAVIRPVTAGVAPDIGPAFSDFDLRLD